MMIMINTSSLFGGKIYQFHVETGCQEAVTPLPQADTQDSEQCRGLARHHGGSGQDRRHHQRLPHRRHQRLHTAAGLHILLQSDR